MQLFDDAHRMGKKVAVHVHGVEGMRFAVDAGIDTLEHCPFRAHGRIEYDAQLVADMVALYWVGMWLGVAARNPKRAFTDTVGRILALPWVAWALFMTFVALFSIRHQFEAGWKAVLGMYFILGVATDIGFGLWARQNMISQFRVVATQRYQSRGSFWKRLFGSGAEHKTE